MLGGICTALLAGMVLYLIIKWPAIPEKVPLHYNAAGEITRWGGRGNALFLPILAVFIYLLMIVVERVPAVWNMPAHAMNRNPEATMQATRTLMIAVRTSIVLMCFCYTVSTANAMPALPYLSAVFLLSVFVPIMVYFAHIHRLSKKQHPPAR